MKHGTSLGGAVKNNATGRVSTVRAAGVRTNSLTSLACGEEKNPLISHSKEDLKYFYVS